jgi:hypothetical protein
MKRKKKMSTLLVDELEMLIYQIDLMLTEDVGELFTTPEEK